MPPAGDIRANAVDDQNAVFDEFVASDEAERIDVECLYGGTIWAVVPSGTIPNVDRTVGAARRAFADET